MASDSKDFRERRHVQLLKSLAGALLMTEIAIPSRPLPAVSAPSAILRRAASIAACCFELSSLKITSPFFTGR
jgi:hypothetical protein